MMRTHRIVLVDDHPILRGGLAQLIGDDPTLEVCGEAASVKEATALLEKVHPDLALVDIFLEGSNGIELTKIIRRRWPRVRVLILSMHDETVYARRALRAGALGYVMKQEVSKTILEAIHTVVEGERYVSENIARALENEGLETKAGAAGPGQFVDVLSDRELEVFEHFGRGMSRSAIAEMLNVSVKTVEAHRQHIREKLEIKDSTDFMRRAMLWVEVERPQG